MFADAGFNRDISKWNVANATDMSFMFFNAKKFNQDLSDWEITDENCTFAMFGGKCPIKPEFKPQNIKEDIDRAALRKKLNQKK